MSYDPTLELDLAQTDIAFANNNHHWCYVLVTVVVDAETGEETQSAAIVVSELHIDPMQYWESDGQIYYKLGHFAAVVDGKREAHLIWGGVQTPDYALVSELHEPVTKTNSSTIEFTLTGQHITASVIEAGLSLANFGERNFSSLTAKPTTIGGYGITDAYTKTESDVRYKPNFAENTAFNKNFGTTAGTVLEGRTFGTAANSNTGDFAAAFLGTANYIPKFTGTGTTIGDSPIYTDGTNVSIGSTSTPSKLFIYNAAGGLTDILLNSNSVLGKFSINNIDQNLRISNSGMYDGNDREYSSIRFFTNSDEITPKLTIQRLGNLGIGTTAPVEKLHVKNGNIMLGGDSGAAYIKLASIGFERTIFNPNINAAEIQFYRGGGGVEGILAFATSNGILQEAMRISEIGSVGIGTTDPLHKLDVKGSIRLSSATGSYIYSESNQEALFIPSGYQQFKASAPNGFEVKSAGTSLISFQITKRESQTGNLTNWVHEGGMLLASIDINGSGYFNELLRVNGLAGTGTRLTTASSDGTLGTTADNSTNWNTAYTWGNHATAGYLTAITKAQVEAVLTGNITSHTHSYAEVSHTHNYDNYNGWALSVNEGTDTWVHSADYASGYLSFMDGLGTAASYAAYVGGHQISFALNINNLTNIVNPTLSHFIAIQSGSIPSRISLTQLQTLIGSGGGSGSVTSVAAGAGMDFSTITGTGTVTMGTPSTLTASTTNSASGTTHTHAITGFLPLTGGTLTGGLSGTTASFSGNVTGATFTLGSSLWTIEVVSAKLVFKYNGTALMSLDTSGNIKAAAEGYRGGL